MKRFGVFLLAIGMVAPVDANDTTAAVGAGGLHFVQNDNIRMLSEELYLSMDEVRVDYEFENLTDIDQHVLVAFPLPDITGEMYQTVSYPVDDPYNYFGFTTTLNGSGIDVDLHQTVFAMGVDRTKDIVKLGLPLAPHRAQTEDAINALSADDKAYLASIGAIAYRYHDGEDTEYYPVWTLKTSYLWDAVFPAGEISKVHHRYSPSVGGTVSVTFLDEEYGTRAEYDQKYCLEDNFVGAVKRNLARADDPYSAPYYETWLTYILSTGANWADSIARFRLIVDKGDERNLVSFCGEGIRKTGPTTFEMVKEDFFPWKDIEVLFLVRQDD